MNGVVKDEICDMYKVGCWWVEVKKDKCPCVRVKEREYMEVAVK